MNAPLSRSPFREHRKRALAGFLLATFLVATLSSLVSTPSIPTWYAALAKPGFNPPNQLFGPVWTLLYALMAIAAWLVWKTPDSPGRRSGLLSFALQMLLNFAWSFLFFREHRLALAFAEILLLWLTILVTMVLFFRRSKPAGWMLSPYLAWVAFAALLNFAIWQRN